tara:strand:+ start:1482 stop:2342 length:861 start_codon:yes stop_codon:yes gene_type:complete
MSGNPHSSVEPPQDAKAGTALDLALQRMARAPDDAAARLRFHAELTQSEIFVLLETEVEGARMTPRVFDLSDGRAVLGFETEWQLAGFAGGAAAYAALPGRVLVSMLAQADQPLSLIVSPDTPHAALLSPEALRWLDQTLAAASPDETEATPENFTAPGLPDGVLKLLVPALERRLSGMPGLGRALLAGVTWRGGGTGHVLAVSGLPQAAQAPLARAVVEALSLSGLEAGVLDVIFPPQPVMERIGSAGLRLHPAPFVMPDDQIVTPQTGAGENPGMNPDRPPKLK